MASMKDLTGLAINLRTEAKWRGKLLKRKIFLVVKKGDGKK